MFNIPCANREIRASRQDCIWSHHHQARNSKVPLGRRSKVRPDRYTHSLQGLRNRFHQGPHNLCTELAVGIEAPAGSPIPMTGLGRVWGELWRQ